MKASILSFLMIISFAAISSEVGESARAKDCQAINQTTGREAKAKVAEGDKNNSPSDTDKAVIGK